MKPCPGHEKLITWLILNALDDPSTRKLRAHLETCPGCRHYLDEMSRITGRISAATPTEHLPSSETFHRQVMNRIKAEPQAAFWPASLNSVLTAICHWRVAVPATAALTAVILFLATIGFRPQPVTRDHPHPVAVIPSPGAAATMAAVAFTPTLANYREAANQSLDKLDAFLERPSQSSSASAQVCRASTTSLNF